MFGIINKERQNVPDTRKTFIDKSFKDREGRMAIGALPNLPIAVWLVSMVLGTFVKHGQAGSLLRVISFGALFTWAWLEILQGVNYFRRVLGLIVLVLLVMGTVQSKNLFV